MTNPAHILETALLVLAAYLLGCAIGYGARRVLHAAHGVPRSQMVVAGVPVATAPPSARSRTPAARLAATASHDDAPAKPSAQHPPKPVAIEKAAPKARAKPKPKPKPKPTAKPKPKPLDPKPLALAEPRGGRADNLKQIKGIGPKIEASLNALGIFHIDQIAGWTGANIDWVDSHLAFKGRIRREHWVEQAIEMSRVKA